MMEAEKLEEFYKATIEKHRKTIEDEVNVEEFKKHLLTNRSFQRAAFTSLNGKKPFLEILLQTNELAWKEKYNLLLSGLKYTGQYKLHNLLEAETVREDGAAFNEVVTSLSATVPVLTDSETTPVAQIDENATAEETLSFPSWPSSVQSLSDESEGNHSESLVLQSYTPHGELRTEDNQANGAHSYTVNSGPSSTTIELKDYRSGEKVFAAKLNPELFEEITFDGKTVRFVLKDSGPTEDNTLLEGEKRLVNDLNSGRLGSAKQDIKCKLDGDVTSATNGSIYMTIELPLTKLPNLSDWLRTGYLCNVLSKALLTVEFKKDFGENVILHIIDVQADLSNSLFSEKEWRDIISCCGGGYENIKTAFERIISPKATTTFSLQVHMKLCYDNVTERVQIPKVKTVYTLAKDIEKKSTKPKRTQPHVNADVQVMPRRGAWRMLTDQLCGRLRRTLSLSNHEKCVDRSRRKSSYMHVARSRAGVQLSWFRAVEEGKREQISSLLNAYPSLLNCTDERKDTALMIASSNGHTETVKRLLKEKCEVNKQDHAGATALWKAANFGYKHTVRALLKSEADVDITTFPGCTPLMAAISSKHADVAMLLLQKGCNINYWYKKEKDELTVVHIAAIIGDRDMVKTLVEHKESNENITAIWQGVGGYNLLHFACSRGYRELASYLITETEININAETTNGEKPIDFAIKNNFLQIAELLTSTSSCKPGYMTISEKSSLKRTDSNTSISSSVCSTLTDNSVSNRSFCSSVTSILTIDEPYRMNGLPYGIAVIITNSCFSEKSGLSYRLGSSLDQDRLVKSFTRLHMEAHSYKDLTAREIRDLLKQYSSSDTEHSCFVFCISSHGKNGFVYGTDGMLIPIIDLTSMFTAEKAANLSGKPKMFIVTACQGNNPVTEKMSYSEVVRKDQIISQKDIIPVFEEDFLVCYSAVPGQASYRDVIDGTPFIKKLTENLDKYGKMRDIEDILRNTTKHLIKTHFGGRKQVCLTFTTLLHPFILRESIHDKLSVQTDSVSGWECRQKITKSAIPTMVSKLSSAAFDDTDCWNFNPVVYYV